MPALLGTIDADGNERRLIVFHLVGLGDTATNQDTPPSTETSDMLRPRAYEAASEAIEATSTDARRIIYSRSVAVSHYVLARASGACESCSKPAPFSRRDGTPYLEPHHTRRVSDGGPDHPRWVAAVCPNCHREIHYGENGVEKNRHLEKHLGTVEGD